MEHGQVAELACELTPTRAGHVQVGHQQVDARVRLGELERLASIRRRQHRVSHSAERSRREGSDRVVVVEETGAGKAVSG